MRRGFVAVLLVVAALWVSVATQVGPAFGHANQARSEPSPDSVLETAPTRVAVWFTEPIEPGLSDIRVLDSQGSRVDDGESLVDLADGTAMSVGLQPLPDGTYTVAWKNVSTVDGHLVRGSFLFSVGEPISGTPAEAPSSPLLQSPAEPVLRWLVLLSVLAMVGGLTFDLLVSRPVMFARHVEQPLRSLGSRLAARSQGLLWLATAVFIAASVAQLLLQTSAARDVSILGVLPGPAWSMLTDTEWGRIWTWRFFMGIGFAVSVAAMAVAARGTAAVAARRAAADEAARSHIVLCLLALGLGGAALWTLSLTSHGAATAGIRWEALVVDYVHLVAAAFWVGALFHFALSIPLVLRSLTPEQRTACLSAMVPRFSVVAALSIVVLIPTGIFSAWAQVNILPAVDTPYGLMLVVKLVIVVPLLGLGAINLLWVRPNLSRNDHIGRWLKRFVIGEAVVAVLVVASVGVLTSLEPARQVAGREGKGVSDSLMFRDTVEGTGMVLEIDPGRVGPNRLVVSLEDRLGAPINDASDVSVLLTYIGADLGEGEVSAVPAGDGSYALEQSLISIAGVWQAELTVQRPDAFDARTAFRFEAGSSGAGGSALITPSPDTARSLLGIGIAGLGFVFAMVALPLGGRNLREGAGVLVPGVAAFLIGVVLLFTGQAEQLRNPFPPTPESLEAGETAYLTNCQTCHGTEGRGDGPAAHGLTPPPADLVVHVPLHLERDLFSFIRDGIPGTAMAPLGSRLGDDEMWDVVNYIKTLGR